MYKSRVCRNFECVDPRSIIVIIIMLKMNVRAFALADMFTRARAQADGWWCESLSLYPTITCDTIDDNVNAARSFFSSYFFRFSCFAHILCEDFLGGPQL